MKKERELKVYEMSGYDYKLVPTIMLKGKWLQDYGFEAGRKIKVCCENEYLIIKAEEMAPEPIVTPGPKSKRVKV